MKILAHILCALALAALGVYTLVAFPHTPLYFVVAVVLIVLAIAVAVPTPLHEGVVAIDSNAPLLTRALGGLIRLGRRETDVVVTPADPPTNAS